jgi:hypothetical protein
VFFFIPQREARSWRGCARPPEAEKKKIFFLAFSALVQGMVSITHAHFCYLCYLRKGTVSQNLFYTS